MRVLQFQETLHVAGGDSAPACTITNNGAVTVCQFTDGTKVVIACDATTQVTASLAIDILNFSKSKGGSLNAGGTYTTSTVSCQVVSISSAADLGKGTKTKPQ
jgi:hypothetical protein